MVEEVNGAFQDYVCGDEVEEEVNGAFQDCVYDEVDEEEGDV